jgi:hypothetical protein
VTHAGERVCLSRPARRQKTAAEFAGQLQNKVYHDHQDCPNGQQISPNNLASGIGGLHVAVAAKGWISRAAVPMASQLDGTIRPTRDHMHMGGVATLPG